MVRLDEKGSEVSVCLKRKANSPPGDKQIRFDSPPTLPSKAPLSVPRTKKGTFPEKKKSVGAIFLKKAERTSASRFVTSERIHAVSSPFSIRRCCPFL